MDLNSEEICRLCFSTGNIHINIFTSSDEGTNKAEVIGQHFQWEVSESDCFPKTVCADCWIKTESFHKLHRLATIAREHFLKTLFKNAVKDENSIKISDEYAANCVVGSENEPIISTIDEKPNINLNSDSHRHVSGNDIEHIFVSNSHVNNQDYFEDIECEAVVDNRDNKSCKRKRSKRNEPEDVECQFSNKRLLHSKPLSEYVKGIHATENEAEQQAEKENKIFLEHFDVACGVCGLNLVSLDKAKSHYMTKHNTQDGYIKCSTCNLQFTETALVNAHMQWHLNPDTFKCLTCGQDMKTKKRLYAHDYWHKMTSQEPRFTCDICKKHFLTRIIVKRHIESVHIPKLLNPNVCGICDKRFISEKYLAGHIKLIHNDHESETNTKDNARNNTRNKLTDTEIGMNQERDRIIAEHLDRSCDVCQTQLESLKAAKAHYFLEHKIRFGYIKCCSCNLKLKHQHMVEDHIDWHLNPEIFKCHLCQQLLGSRATLKMHVDSHKAMESQTYVCPLCNKPFGRKNILKVHIKKFHPEYAKKLDAGSREKRNDLMVYNENVHSENEDKAKKDDEAEMCIPDYFDMACEICFVHLESLHHAKLHYLHEHCVMGYIRCCNIKLKHPLEVQEHVAWHSNPEMFKCAVCNKTFKTKHNLRTHFLRHKSKYECTVCGKSLANNFQLGIHQVVHEKNDKSFKCEFCKKCFAHGDYLKSHIRRNHKPTNNQICEICAKVCKSTAQLRKHLLTHSDEPPKLKEKAQCEICGAWLTDRYKIKIHMLCHTSGPQKCDQCDKVSPNQNALKMHMRAVHIDANHKCHLCDKSFKQAAALKDHVATHTGEKLYKCAYCQEMFIWRPNCYSHQKKAHPREWSEDQARKVSAKQAK